MHEMFCPLNAKMVGQSYLQLRTTMCPSNDMLYLENFDKRLPKFHLRGINSLIETGSFADNDGSSKTTFLATISAMNANRTYQRNNRP